MKYYTGIKHGRNITAGIGSALVDILSHESSETLELIGGSKGGMTLVDSDFIENTLQKLKGNPVYAPGGAACNTINGIGKLGGKARFIAKYGDDDTGIFFKNGLESSGVETFLISSTKPTGRVISVITEDAQRTMFTYLGASSDLHPDEISEKYFENCAVVFIEGYLLFNRELIIKSLECAKRSGAVIALDLASFTVVESSMDIIHKLVSEYVDILIANEDEAKYYTGTSDETRSIEILSENVDIGVLKRGKNGSIISYKGEIFSIDPVGDGSAVDTTGAGDLWAAGFIYGLVNGMDIEKSGKLASLCGYEVCQVNGAVIPDESWNRIKQTI
jgi:sugar/nucleoside kinase (ribokinase family)